MKLSYSGNIFNTLETGATQILYGERLPHMAGIWKLNKNTYYIYLKDFIGKEIDETLACNIDWNKIRILLWNKFDNKEVNLQDIEQMSIIDLLIKIGAATDDNGNISIINNYLYKNSAPDKSLEIIDITEQANPRKEEKREN